MIISIDIETTGFSKIKNDIIQLAAVEIFPDYSIGRTFNCFMRPKRPQYWQEGAERVHGISLQRAMTFPVQREGIIDFMVWLAPLMDEFPLSFVYHGKNLWDYHFLKQSFLDEGLVSSYEKVFREVKSESTHDLAKECLPHLKDFKLNTVAEALGFSLNHHEALSDALVCGQIYAALKPNLEAYKGVLL